MGLDNPLSVVTTTGDQVTMEGNNAPNAPSVYRCNFCDRTFSTKSGRGVHEKRKHPDVLDEVRVSAQQSAKVRWTDEELRILARAEVNLVKSGTRFINVELAKQFSNRSLEAIKKARQKEIYRGYVSDYLTETHVAATEPTLELADTFLEDVQAMQLSASPINDALKLIMEEAPHLEKEETLVRLSSLLATLFRPRPRSRRVRAESGSPRNPNRRQRRRIEFARVQRNFQLHQGRCIKNILDGLSDSHEPSQDIMEPYWHHIMSQTSLIQPSDESLQSPGTATISIWYPIRCAEIHKLDASTSPGPDGLTASDINGIKEDTLATVLSLIMWCGKLPLAHRDSRTIFIPKKENSSEPGDFRPITVPSVLARLLNQILARRLLDQFPFDSRQRAFIRADGCADNTTLLDMLLRDHHQRHAACYIASLDVSKAFDTVSHKSIIAILNYYGFDKGFVEYVGRLLQDSPTVLCGKGWVGSALVPGRGVKQGDPLSPLLFNVVVNRLLETLPKEVGSTLGDFRLNAMAFADDLILIGKTSAGLQLMIDNCSSFLNSCGMSINTAKSLTISIEANAKKKITMVNSFCVFRDGECEIPSLKRSDKWRYLGVTFTPEGRTLFKPKEELIPKLNRLQHAPLKPQQRMHALRTILIPQLYHKITLGNIKIGCLNKADRTIRSTVRKWLRLPSDTPISYFHAPVSSGGLGVPALRWVGPLLRVKRLNNLKMPCLDSCATANTLVATEVMKAERRLRLNNGNQLQSQQDILDMWSRRLNSTVDGAGLSGCEDLPQVNRWIREPTKMLSGRDYINAIKLRINALPTRSRTARGRAEIDRSCRAGCRCPETLNHILQQCHRTHGPRIARHDAVVKYVKRNLENRGYQTTIEPIIRLPNGTTAKPDIVACKDRTVWVLDAQVRTDGNLDAFDLDKARKYDREDLKTLLRRRYDAVDVKCCGITLNWRGVWSKRSAKILLSAKMITKHDLAVISTRVIIGGIASHIIFNRSTSIRTGVG